MPADCERPVVRIDRARAVRDPTRRREGIARAIRDGAGAGEAALAARRAVAARARAPHRPPRGRASGAPAAARTYPAVAVALRGRSYAPETRDDERMPSAICQFSRLNPAASNTPPATHQIPLPSVTSAPSVVSRPISVRTIPKPDMARGGAGRGAVCRSERARAPAPRCRAARRPTSGPACPASFPTRPVAKATPTQSARLQSVRRAGIRRGAPCRTENENMHRLLTSVLLRWVPLSSQSLVLSPDSDRIVMKSRERTL